jgi:hypothetical protein
MKPQSRENGNPWYGERRKEAFGKIKREVANVPALGLSYVMKPSFLYVHERLGTALM